MSCPGGSELCQGAMNVAVPLPDPPLSGFAADLHDGLLASPKKLPPRYFYDALGSHLFDAICHLPWYPITRAESRLLELHGAAMVEPLGGLSLLIELGCGSGDKIAVLAGLLGGRPRPGVNGSRAPALPVHLVDVSEKALELTRRALARIEHVTVTSHRATYEDGLRSAVLDRPSRGGVLVLFLGSNVGNFEPPAAEALLREIRKDLRPGDALLLGADLVKPQADLLAAYDDPLGVTAVFNKNVLLRANRELGANFDLRAFDHHAVWDEAASRIEMHLVSRRRQSVRVPAARLDVTFAEGESIWTESSYKYTPAGLGEMGRRAGLGAARQWIDPELRFATTLFVAE
jgi:L-histidine Nalpha-methyltransferase